MPVIAAMDNETLDHLLSVVDDARNLASLQALSKPGKGHMEKHESRSEQLVLHWPAFNGL